MEERWAAPLERISIIIAARNEGQNVRKTIESLLLNTFYPDFEVLVMDDASEDGCCDFLSSPPYCRDPRLKWVRSERQLFAVGEHIRGAELASGGVFRFLDAHHCFSPFWLSNQYHSLRRRDFRAIVGSVIGVLDAETWRLTPTISFGWGIDPELSQIWHLGRDQVGQAGRIPWTGTPQIMVSRAVYQEIGGFLPYFQKYGAEDIEFCLRAYRFGYDCFVEPASSIGHLYKSGFVNQVTWTDLRLNNLILTYLHLDESLFERLCAEKMDQPGFLEGLGRFEQLKPRLEQLRRRLLARQARPLTDLWASPSMLSLEKLHSVKAISASVQASLIISSHNEGENLARTVASLLEHTHQVEYELLLIDDGSDDHSFDFLEMAPFSEMIHLRRMRFNQAKGLIFARHAGAEAAQGEVLVFLDAHLALPDGWLIGLLTALERWGPLAVVTPDIAGLNPATWTPERSSGKIVAVDEQFDMVWQQAAYPSKIVPIVLGCCWVLPRRLYFQVGGFDTGLRRWGCENIDISLKVYAIGGVCLLEPAVLVGHLFRKTFPYPVNFEQVIYNKLRVGFVHLPAGSFMRLCDRLAAQPGFPSAYRDLLSNLPQLQALRRKQQAIALQPSGRFLHMFLPGLLEGSQKSDERNF